MARGKLITKEQDEKMVKMAKQGFNISQIAREIGCSTYAVDKRVRGILSKKNGTVKRMEEEQIKGMRDMRSKGVKHQDIADKYNCCLFTVHRHVKDIKVETKKQTIIKALNEGADLDKIVKRNGYDKEYVSSIINMFGANIDKEKYKKCEKREMELIKQKALLEENKRLRAKELEELRQQEIRDFRWGGTVRICWII